MSEKIKIKDFFNRKFKLYDDLNISSHIEYITTFIEKEYGVKTCREELLIDISTEQYFDYAKDEFVITRVLVVKPSQELLKKFEKDYPESLI